MEIGSTVKVRLVKCPKCRLILPEPTGVPVYKCGGCSTVLQVKNRMNDAKRTEAAQMIESDHVEAKNSTDSNQTASVISSGERSLDGNIGRDQDISSDCNGEKSGGVNSSNEDKNDESYHNESRDCNIHQPGVSDKFCSSTEFAHCENGDASQLNGANSEVEVKDESSQLAEAKLAVDIDDQSDSTSRSSNAENAALVTRPAGEHVSLDVLISSPDEHPKQLRTNSKHCYDSVRSNDAFEENLEVEVIDKSSHLAEAKPEVDINNESDSTSRSSNAENASLVTQENNLLAGESVSSDILMSSPDEHTKQLGTTFENGYDRVRSSDAFGANSKVEVNDKSSHLVEAKPEVDINNESDSTSRSSNAENASLVTRENNSPARESVSSDVLMSSHDEQPKQLGTTFENGYDRVRSSDAFGANSEVEVNDKSSHLAEATPEVHINNESDSASRSSKAENASLVTQENNSPAGESVSSDVLISSPDEQPKQLGTTFENGRENGYDRVRSSDAFRANSEVEVNDQSSQLVEAKPEVDVASHRPAGEQPKQLRTSFKRGYDRVRSNDTFENTSYFSPSSEFSGSLDYMSKSPTIRSSHAYYDGSVSSFDGIDDQVPEQHVKSYKNRNKFESSEEIRSRRDKFLVNVNPEMRRQTRNLSYAVDNHRQWVRDELLRESTRPGHAAVRNGTRFERDKFQDPVSFYQRDYLAAGYESGNASSQLQDEFHNHSGQQERIKLLKMVYELQDQLNRTGFRGSSEVTGKEMYAPAYYSPEISEEEISRELNYHRYPERYRPGSNWSHQYNYSCPPFSGEVTNNRQCIDNSCLHCCPQDWQFSTQLPPPIHSHSRGFCTFHPGHSYSSHRSCPSSPKQFTDSEFPICYRETNSDVQRHEEYHVKRHVKEQTHSVKRHLRPTAGGAPFVICYRCLKPLQLPADFLLFKKRFHQLKCGACSEVLKFSLENRIHIVPYAPKAEAPPRSEVVDYRDAVNRRNSSSSYGNDYPQADPVSCSEDYGLSYCKSYSTDGDPVFLASFNNIQGNANARNMSYDSLESTKEGNRFVPKPSQNKNKSPVQTYESAGTSSSKSRSGKVSSEIKELTGKTGSPLHWLMGYNSPSQVIRGSDDPSCSGTSSLHT
ncbi:hypothetical protein Dsin_002219 [Dipteronia sinensis]|uniref:Zinc-ribbon domain-containing protein n=1 Tax=Dipteronia sinensis TaxID=43782 RepID=A0AAE0B5E7_9ROSI|nr:hypothetical protein Dsin_002219 [Dipteronia sinensis]